MKKNTMNKKMSDAAWSIFRGGALISITALLCAVITLLFQIQNVVHIQNITGFVKSLIELACSSLLISALGAAFINEQTEKAR